MTKVAGAKKDAEAAVNSILEIITKALKEGNNNPDWFCTFSVTWSAARKERNLQTGEEMKIPTKKVTEFTPGKGLRAAKK